MSLIKQRIEALCQIKEIMIKERITLKDIRENWELLDNYMNKDKEE